MFWQYMVQSPPSRVFIRSLTPPPLLAYVYTRKTDFSKPGTSTRGQVCYLHYTTTCWQAGSVSKCHISTFTWSLAVPTDIHQNLVQSTLWCVCADIFTGQIAALVFDPKWSNGNTGSYILISVTLKRNVNLYLPYSETVCIGNAFFFVFFSFHVAVFSFYIVSAIIKFWKIHCRSPWPVKCRSGSCFMSVDGVLFTGKPQSINQNIFSH